MILHKHLRAFDTNLTGSRRDILSRSVRRAPLVVLPVLVAGCASAGGAGPAPAYGGLNATLWTQTAVEYRAIAVETYEAAGRALERALAEDGWTAALEQPRAAGSLPPAVILDVDETVLDNGAYQGRLLVDGASYSSESWAAWVGERRATAVPGALAFTRSAAARGVAVFYVTNRDAPLEPDTRANLERLGFPVGGGGEDRLLMRGERPDWTSDKGSRRAEVARSYRIVLLIGDDLTDFVTVPDTPGARDRAFERHADRWGNRWFVIPNPMYGSWERALLGGADGDPVRAKLERVETDRPPESAPDLP